MKRGQTVLVALNLALAVALSAAACAAIGYFQLQRLAGNERLAAERAERANAELQDALSRMRDQLAAAQFRVDALTGELAAAQERMRVTDELQRQLAVYQGAQVRRTTLARGKSGPAGKTQDTPAVPVSNPPDGSQQPAGAAGSSPMAVAAGELKNFNPPGWVPSYFSGESAPFLGSGKQ